MMVGIMTNVLQFVFTLDILVSAGDCPEKDQSCVAADGSNVITTTTTSDDAECGRKFSIFINYFGGLK